MPRKAGPWWRSSRNNTGRWYVTLHGKQHPLPITDRTDEAGAWEALKTLVKQATSEAGPAPPAGRPEPVSALVAEYLARIGPRVSDKTKKDYATHLRKFVAHFGDLCSGRIDPQAVENCAAGYQWSDSHRANFLWSVQAFVRWTGRKDFALTRPAKESRGADAVIPPDVHARVLRETTGDFHQLCRLLWITGARPMEAANLTAEGVDWTSGTATLKRHKTKKKGKQRVLYFNTDALTVLREQAEKYDRAGLLFRGVGGRPLTRHAVVCRFIRLSEKIGRTVRAYDYRHSFITRALEGGVPDAQVAALVGHSSTAMIHKFYSHVSANGRILRDVVEKLAG